MEQSTRAEQSVTVQLDVPAQMRDGVTLRANVYRPDGDGPWPTLLTRTPYGKDDPEIPRWLDPVQIARRGFMIVVQDTRGCFASEGEWSPFEFEREDGYDTVEWAARLPGANGRVGMYGLSYLGSTQWTAAIEQPPSLAAISPALTWSDPLDGVFARGGALELGVAVAWTCQTNVAHLMRLPLSDEEREQRVQSLVDDFDRLLEDGYWDLPVDDMAVLRRNDVPGFRSIRLLENPDVAEWSRVSGHHERVTVPSLHTASWYDIFLQGALDNYMAMTALGRPTRLVIGPWTHLTFSDPIGERCFGTRGRRLGVPGREQGDFNDTQVAWFRRHLLPEADAPASEAPVRLFVMGRNEWRDETAWPLERARVQRWHLHAGGALGPDAPGVEGDPTEFAYDPADPAPTLGGPTLMAPGLPSGAFDQRDVEARDDVLVFTSAPLPAELEVTGRIRMILHAESSAPSTDWVARLCDVHPDGRSYNLCDGITRIVEGADTCRRIEIDLWSTSNAFLAGHRLRVHVTSSSFPRWDRNLNTGDQHAPDWQTAHQRIYHDAQHPSFIELPVVA